jgi:hypothetical protein
VTLSVLPLWREHPGLNRVLVRSTLYGAACAYDTQAYTIGVYTGVHENLAVRVRTSLYGFDRTRLLPWGLLPS